MSFDEGMLSGLDLMMRHNIEGISVEDLLMIVVIEIGLVNNGGRNHVLEGRVIINGLGVDALGLGKFVLSGALRVLKVLILMLETADGDCLGTLRVLIFWGDEGLFLGLVFARLGHYVVNIRLFLALDYNWRL
jgi:hypothetical protein